MEVYLYSPLTLIRGIPTESSAKTVHSSHSVATDRPLTIISDMTQPSLSPESISRDLDLYYRKRGIHPLEFDCSSRADCAKGCDKFSEARASLIGAHYGEADTPRIAVLSLDRGGGYEKPEERTLEAVRDRENPNRVRALPKGRHWYQTHSIVAALLAPYLPGLDPVNATGRFAHINAAKCCQHKKGKAVADRRLFTNCRPYLRGEFEIVRPHIVITQGVGAANALKKTMASVLTRIDESYFEIDLCGTPTFWLRTHHPGAWHGVYQEQKKRWPEFVDAAADWFRSRGER